MPNAAHCGSLAILADSRDLRGGSISRAREFDSFWDFPNCKFYDIKNRKNIHNYNTNIPDPATLVRHRTEPSSPISDFGADPAHCAKRTMSLRRPIATPRPPMGH